jgi:hypothetical protein
VTAGVAEAGREIAEPYAGMPGGHVVGPRQRPVAADDHRGLVLADPLGEPRRQLIGVTSVGDVQVGVERLPGQLDGAPDTFGARAPRPLIEEDGGRRARFRQGSSDNSCSTEASSCPATVKATSSAM